MDNDDNELMETKNGDDSDDSSSTDEEENALLNRTELLERQLSNNKYLYDTHEELVNIYRKLGDLKSMRSAYERFHEYFPLTSKIWLNWINDEKRLASTESEIKNIFSLYDKAVEDYLSVELWLEYAQYSLSTSDMQTTRKILEKALTAAGLDAAEGSLLWDNLRELELAQLSVITVDTELWQEQLIKVVEVFRRQLSVPLMGMESTYHEWEEWLKTLPITNHKIDHKPIEWGYQKALKTLETYKEFEDKLLATQEPLELYQVYKDYIKVITDPSTVLCVYGRAVAQMCLSVDVWADYCNYALKLGEAALKISNRALRNCPWSEELWIIRLRIMEHLSKSNDDIMACFERGLTSIVPSLGLDLWLAYLEYMHRISDSKKKLYKLFDQSIEQLGIEGDCNLKISRWYGRLLAKDGDMVGARKLWKKIVYQPQNKGTASVWLEYANLERQYGEPSHLRILFQKALTSCTDWPQCIADEWMMFERETGKLEDVLKCVEKCKELLKQVNQQTQIEQQTVVDNELKLKGIKRKHNKDNNGEIIIETKRSKNEDKPGIIHIKKPPIDKNPTKTVFISNLYPSISEQRLKKVFPNAINIELVLDKYGKSRCYGYVQFTMEEEVLTALARDRELLDGRPMFISNCKPDRNERKAAFKYSVNTESNKLFVRGLPLDKTQEDIEAIFKPYGAKDVRLVLQKNGKSKGLAYIEFDNETDTKKALQNTDQMKIGEYTITVAISAPPPKGKGDVQSAPVRQPRSRIQVPLIPRTLQVGKSLNDNSKPSVSTASKSNDDFRKMLLNK